MARWTPTYDTDPEQEWAEAAVEEADWRRREQEEQVEERIIGAERIVRRRAATRTRRKEQVAADQVVVGAMGATMGRINALLPTERAVFHVFDRKSSGEDYIGLRIQEEEGSADRTNDASWRPTDVRRAWATGRDQLHVEVRTDEQQLSQYFESLKPLPSQRTFALSKTWYERVAKAWIRSVDPSVAVPLTNEESFYAIRGKTGNYMPQFDGTAKGPATLIENIMNNVQNDEPLCHFTVRLKALKKMVEVLEAYEEGERESRRRGYFDDPSNTLRRRRRLRKSISGNNEVVFTVYDRSGGEDRAVDHAVRFTAGNLVGFLPTRKGEVTTLDAKNRGFESVSTGATQVVRTGARAAKVGLAAITESLKKVKRMISLDELDEEESQT